MIPNLTFVARIARSFLWVALFTLSSLYAQEVEWTRQFGTPGGDELRATAVDAGDVYVAGNFGINLPGQAQADLKGAVLRKYGANPLDVWTKQLGADQIDSVQAILIHAGCLYVAGQGRGEIVLGKYAPDGSKLRTWPFGTPGEAMGLAASTSGIYVVGWTPGALPDQRNLGDSDAFVRKYDPEGNELWTRQLGTTMLDLARAVASDSSGVYIAGWTRGTLPGQVRAGGTTDAFVRKYDPEGTELWTEQFGSGNDEGCWALTIDAATVYVVGDTLGGWDGFESLGSTDMFVRMYSPNGDDQGTLFFGTDREDHVRAVSVDGSALYLAGFTWGALRGQRNVGKSDAFVVNFDFAPGQSWSLQIGTPEADTLNSMVVDSQCVYVCGDTGGIFAGIANAGLTDAYLMAFRCPSPQSLQVDLFSDADGNLLHDPGEETATTSPGGEVRFLADFINTAEVALTVTATVDGLPAGWAEVPEPFVLLSGESLRDSIVVRVPENAGAVGSHALTLRADTAQGDATASARLEVLRVPLIHELLPPDGIVTARTAVAITWRTSAETTGRAHVRNVDTGIDESPDPTAEFSREHGVELTGLELGGFYEWWVESAGRWGGSAVAPSDPLSPEEAVPRRFLVGNGVVFSQREYDFTVDRDYNQVVELGIENVSEETRDVVLRIENPYADVAIGFVGTGSVEEPAVVRASQKRDVELGVHLQEADPARVTPYVFTAELRSTRGGTSVVVDSVPVRVSMERPAVDFAVVQVGGLEAGTLAASFRVENRGSVVTDLAARAGEGLAGLVQLVPTVENARLGTGESLQFRAVPVRLPDGGLAGRIVVSGAGETREVTVTFVEPVNEELFTHVLTDVTYCTSARDQGCTNRRRFSVRLELPAGIQREAIEGATLSVRIAPQSSNHGSPHDLTVTLNGHEVGVLRRTLPNGVYRFEVPPEILNVSPTQVSVNTVVLAVSGLSGGNYYLASETTLCVCLKEFECRVYAPNAEVAQERCRTLPGLRLSGGAVEGALEPLPGVVERETVTLRVTATQGGLFATELLLEARFSSGDPAVVLSHVGRGVYEGKWTPACAGRVKVEIHARGCEAGLLDEEDVDVGFAPERNPILPVPSYDPGGTAWDWAAALSGLLRYHGYGLKPWTIAAAVGADPSQGLDLREVGDDLREPSLATILRYLKEDLGLRVGVKKYKAADAEALPCQVRGSVQEGHPLWLAYGDGVTGESRVLLVAEASADTVWVHEMEGAGGEPRLRIPLTWADLTAKVLAGESALAVAVEILSVASEGSGLSLSLPPGMAAEETGGLRIVHSRGLEELKLLWDGREPLGYVLGNVVNEVGSPERWIDPAPVFPPDAVTGWSGLVGDALELSLQVANGGGEAVEATVEVAVKHLRSGRRVVRQSAPRIVAPGEWNEVVAVFPPASALILEPQGQYELKVSLLEAGAVVDSVVMPFRVRCPAGVRFVRGDVGKRVLGGQEKGADEAVNISDAIQILSWLFLDEGQTELDCAKAADANDDGVIDIADPVRILGFLFLGALPPPAPYPAVGIDLTPDDLDCCQYPGGAP